MEIKKVKLSALRLNPNNPRLIKDFKFKQLVKSILTFPKMLELREIVTDETMMVLGGNMRFRALQEIASMTENEIKSRLKQYGREDLTDYWIAWHDCPMEIVKIGTGLTDAEKKEFIDKDNLAYGEWDWESLANQYDIEVLQDWGHDVPIDWGNDAESKEMEKEAEEDDTEEVEGVKMTDRYLIPPFSILDTRQGYWQKRKKQWIAKGIESGEGRNEELLGKGLNQLIEKQLKNTSLTGTSIFDPVLCEIAYRWFCIDGGSVYDPFAGGSVRGIVASLLGYKYMGIELRQEQVDANRRTAEKLNVSPEWICDDSQNADKYIEDDSCDMILSCPPYADLEVYSDDPRDISNMQYDDFCKVYKRIIDIAVKKLKNNRFVVWVVGDVRDKKGYYRMFVDYTKKCFADNGLHFYNDLILVENNPMASPRINGCFKNRVLPKIHQNVLVFYKGDKKEIQKNFPPIDFSEIEDMFNEDNEQ